MCALLVGLPAVKVIGVADWPLWLRVVIETPAGRPECGCGGVVHRHGVREVELVDLAVFGRPVRLMWRTQRWRCTTCGRCWCDDNAEIATARCALTTRAARWSTLHVGRNGRAVADVARELGCGWHAVMDAVVVIGEQLVDHPERIGAVTALGLDETLFARIGRFRTQHWSTQIVDVRRGQLLDVVPAEQHQNHADGSPNETKCGGTASSGPRWICRRRIAACSTAMLPAAVQVADPFHVVRLANTALDECRRRVQNETLGHRGLRQQLAERYGHQRADSLPL